MAYGTAVIVLLQKKELKGNKKTRTFVLVKFVLGAGVPLMQTCVLQILQYLAK